MSQTCEKCGGKEFAANGDCKACKRVYNKAYREKAKAAGGKTKAKNVKPAIAIVMPERAPVLEIQQGHGIKAWIDEPYIMLEQADGEGATDAICLSRSEFRQLVDKFGSWAC